MCEKGKMIAPWEAGMPTQPHVMLLGIVGACRDQAPPPPVEQPVATVNGEPIGLQEFAGKLAEGRR